MLVLREICTYRIWGCRFRSGKGAEPLWKEHRGRKEGQEGGV